MGTNVAGTKGARGRWPGWTRIAAAALLIIVASGGASRAVDPKLEETFKAFCVEWMKKLAVRERDNRAGIKWVTVADGVQGEFIGYSTESVCAVKEPASASATPVGTIKYRETRYRKVGPTREAAAAGDDTALEVTEVTEIFRFSGGKWVY